MKLYAIYKLHGPWGEADLQYLFQSKAAAEKKLETLQAMAKRITDLFEDRNYFLKTLHTED